MCDIKEDLKLFISKINTTSITQNILLRFFDVLIKKKLFIEKFLFFYCESLELELELSDEASSWEASLCARLVSSEIDC